MIPKLIFLIAAFGVGSLSSAIITSRILRLPDPRTFGSKNPGATNILRTGNKKQALIVLLGDAMKGFVPVFVALFFLNFDFIFSVGVLAAAVVGHIFPIFFRFRGGKGVATFAGGLLALEVWTGVIFLLIWILVFKITKISSLAALIAVFFAPMIFYGLNENFAATIILALVAALIFFAHRGNISRLFRRGENKF